VTIFSSIFWRFAGKVNFSRVWPLGEIPETPTRVLSWRHLPECYRGDTHQTDARVMPLQKIRLKNRGSERAINCKKSLKQRVPEHRAGIHRRGGIPKTGTQNPDKQTIKNPKRYKRASCIGDGFNIVLAFEVLISLGFKIRKPKKHVNAIFRALLFG